MDNKPCSVRQWFSAHIPKIHAVRIRDLRARRDLEYRFSLQRDNDDLGENAANHNSLSGLRHAAAQSNTDIITGQSDTVTKLSDGAQMVLPIVLAIGDGVPVVGGVVKAVAGGLLYLLERMEASFHLSVMTYPIYYIPCPAEVQPK